MLDWGVAVNRGSKALSRAEGGPLPMRAGSLGPSFQLVGDSTLYVLSLAISSVGEPLAMEWELYLHQYL